MQIVRLPVFLALGSALVCTTVIAQNTTCDNENAAIEATTPDEDFTIHGDGTVTHKPTGLMWMQCSLGSPWNGTDCTARLGDTVYARQDAMHAVVEFNEPGGFNNEEGFAGYADWRLPSRPELASIIERRCWNPAINTLAFPNTPNEIFWSSTIPFAVRFDRGLYSGAVLPGLHRVRLVRAGH